MRAERNRIRHPAARKLEPQKISQGELNTIHRRLLVIDEWSKRFGCRMGLIGDNGFKVWRYLAYAFAMKGLACFPSRRHIAKKVNIARSTVGEALNRLKRVGALSWMERPSRKNGRRIQGTNLYTLHMPGQEAHKLPLLKRVRKRVFDPLAKVVKSVVKSAAFPGFFRETGIRPHGATPDINNSRLDAIRVRCDLARERKAGKAVFA
jgi:hypothetical protein